MKKIVIFYSLDGNTRFIAERIAQAIGAELLELKLKRPFKAKGFFKYFFGGFSAVRKTTPELLPLEKHPEDYDFLVLGTPVWASRFAPALRTFLAQHPLKGKKIALFSCAGGGDPGSTFEEFHQILKDNEIVGELALKDPLRHDPERSAHQAQEWISSLV